MREIYIIGKQARRNNNVFSPLNRIYSEIISETTIFYPSSKRKIKVDKTGKIIYDSALGQVYNSLGL
jgi:hypothetical protein